LKRLQRELGISFVHVTHSQDEALALADLIIVMNRGKIEQAGSAEDVFNRPRSEFVARFMGGHNVFAQSGGKFSIRADKIAIAKKPAAGAARFEAVVREIEFLGSTYAVTLNSQTAEDGVITVSLSDAQFTKEPLEIGQTVFLNWRPGDVHPLAD
jgi:putative spermidine/putrescine transport system ATP-binding protein